MGIKTSQEFIESLRDDRVVYCLGEKVNDVTQHPILGICANWVAMEYVLTQDPRYRDLMVEKNEDGEETNFSLLPIYNKKDLLRRREIVKTEARICFGKPPGAKWVGIDCLNALTVVTPRVDKEFGTNYAERVKAYRKHLQKYDLTAAGAVMDVKGDRSLRPSDQKLHKDYYVRVVEDRSDGMIVRGAKAHISHAPCNNEIVVQPSRAMREEDKDYAVAFAVPANTKGITLITSEPEILEGGNYFDYPITGSIYLADSMVIFDDVFVPNERIFMKREWPRAGDLVYTFADFHRLSAETYKAAELEIITGAAALMAEYNGLEKVPHIHEKLSWLVMHAEGTEILGKAACEQCVSDPESGLVYPNPMIANIAKFFYADNWHQATKNLQDIAGGILATAPSAKDYFNPETHDLIEKYLSGKAGVSAEHRIRLIKLIRDLTSCYEDVLTIHGEGSLAAQKLSISAIADFGRYKAAAKRAARIEDGTEHPIYSALPDFPAKL